MDEGSLARFVAVVEAGSVSEAARALDMPRATLSRQLSRLEGRLGVRLLHRSTRRLVPTEAGLELYRRARTIVDAVADAEAAVRGHGDEPAGVLRVSTLPGMGELLGQLAAVYLSRHPAVELILDASGRHVDLVAEGFDVAIRAGTVRDPSLVARRLQPVRAEAVASPAYLAARGRPEVPDDLASHLCLRGSDTAGRPQTTWPLVSGGTVRVSGPLVANDLRAVRGAVLAGLGVAVLPSLLVEADLAEGALELVLAGVVGTHGALHVVYPEREYLQPKVRAFVDLVVHRLGGPENLAAMKAASGR